MVVGSDGELVQLIVVIRKPQRREVCGCNNKVKVAKMDDGITGYVFADAEQALVWSAEVLRRRRLPKLTRMWDDLQEEVEFVARAWEGEKHFSLPADEVGRLDLALKVERALDAMAKGDREGAQLLKLWVWGDWADDARLQRALTMQEVLRRRGMRARLSYRYTYAQLGQLLEVDRKAAWRRVQEALGVLGRELLARELVAGVCGEPTWEEEEGRPVRAQEFVEQA